ncbi:MAG: 3-phosphoshikimate 1-carboxyvinyltransferase, partial [Myxococcota bacterium]
MTNARTPDVLRIRGGASLRGELVAPGDKSISHRAIILGSLAEGETRVTNLAPGEDSRRTIDALRAMGVAIDGRGGGIRIRGAGLRGLRPPAAPIDCGNSGTAMRLLAGVLAGQPFEATLTGDASLSRRPMRRIVLPLREMGARISGNAPASGDGGITPPLRVSGPPGGGALRAIRYTSPVPSAQVKSAVLLAGLYADGETTFEEPAPSRDHTERMLAAFGAKVKRDGRRVSLAGGFPLAARPVAVPGDLSSAAFFLVAALITPGSEVCARGVGVNPTRTGVLDVLRAMGANITLRAADGDGGEPEAEIIARHGALSPVD